MVIYETVVNDINLRDEYQRNLQYMQTKVQESIWDDVNEIQETTSIYLDRNKLQKKLSKPD